VQSKSELDIKRESFIEKLILLLSPAHFTN